MFESKIGTTLFFRNKKHGEFVLYLQEETDRLTESRYGNAFASSLIELKLIAGDCGTGSVLKFYFSCIFINVILLLVFFLYRHQG